MKDPQPSRLLTVQDVATATRLSVSFVYKLVERQAVPHHRIGSQIRFTLEDLERWLAESRVEVGGTSR